MIYSQVQIRLQKQKEAFIRGDMKLVKDLAYETKQEGVSNGFVSARPIFARIEKEWLDKALQEGVISFHSKEYGYQIVAIHRIEDKITSYRGRIPITVKKETIDISKWLDFYSRYKAYREKQEKRDYGVTQELNQLVLTKNMEEKNYHENFSQSMEI